MRCHYTYDKEAGKVWIPGCYSGIYDPANCCCSKSFKQFERDEFNQTIKAKDKEIKDLEGEVFRLERVIKKLLKR